MQHIQLSSNDGLLTIRLARPKANALNFDTLIKNLSLDAKRTACR